MIIIAIIMIMIIEGINFMEILKIIIILKMRNQIGWVIKQKILHKKVFEIVLRLR